MKKVRKLSDVQFYAILRANGGIYARTAKAIKETYGIEYSRQAVRERALKRPDIVADIDEEFVDDAEGCLHSLLDSDNHSVRLKTAELILKTKGKKRGYSEKKELEITSQTNGLTAAEALIMFVLIALDKGCGPDAIVRGLAGLEEVEWEAREQMIKVINGCKMPSIPPSGLQHPDR